MNKFYNIDQMVSVERHGKGYGEIEWRPKSRFMPGKEGYWSVGCHRSFDFHGAVMPENFSEDENGVYRKPYIDICFSDKVTRRFYYDSEEAMDSDFRWLSGKIGNIFGTSV